MVEYVSVVISFPAGDDDEMIFGGCDGMWEK